MTKIASDEKQVELGENKNTKYYSEKTSFSLKWIFAKIARRQSEFQIHKKLHQIAHERKRAPNTIHSLFVVFSTFL